jgi:predicted O-methyltransferase YrrM
MKSFIDLNALLSGCNWKLKGPDSKILLETAISIKPKTIVEVGGGIWGCSTVLLALVAKECGGHVYSIEPQINGEWRSNLDKFNVSDYVTRICDWSTNVSRCFFSGMDIDYLFIDGDHRTRWVLADYHYWEPLVRKGGCIAFHDYNDTKIGMDVRRALDIINETDSGKLEEVGRWNGVISCGIIVFRKGNIYENV